MVEREGRLLGREASRALDRGLGGVGTEAGEEGLHRVGVDCQAGLDVLERVAPLWARQRDITIKDRGKTRNEVTCEHALCHSTE